MAAKKKAKKTAKKVAKKATKSAPKKTKVAKKAPAKKAVTAKKTAAKKAPAKKAGKRSKATMTKSEAKVKRLLGLRAFHASQGHDIRHLDQKLAKLMGKKWDAEVTLGRTIPQIVPPHGKKRAKKPAKTSAAAPYGYTSTGRPKVKLDKRSHRYQTAVQNVAKARLFRHTDKLVKEKLVTPAEAKTINQKIELDFERLGANHPLAQEAARKLAAQEETKLQALADERRRLADRTARGATFAPGGRALPTHPSRRRAGVGKSAKAHGRAYTGEAPSVSAAAPARHAMSRAEYEAHRRKVAEAGRLPHFPLPGEDEEPVTLVR